MGIPMANIHAPSIPPTTHPSNPTPTSQSDLQSLIARKDALETELKALGAVLDSHNVTMTTPLTTPDDFPRTDIDVPAVRTARARILAARNDYKAAMRAIEPLLHAHFAAGADAADAPRDAADPDADADADGSRDSSRVHADAQADTPTFARIASVEPGSPAAGAGLAAGDRVAVFGGADWLNHEKLARVAREVAGCEGRGVRVVVLRGGTAVEVEVVPRRGWGGRGLLGCHLVLE